MLFVRPLASSGNGHLCFGKNMHEWGWCEVASYNDQHDIALTIGVAAAAAAAAAFLQTVRIWKGTIREYKAHLAKKMGVVH
jgi:hypothetical protein